MTSAKKISKLIGKEGAKYRTLSIPHERWSKKMKCMYCGAPLDEGVQNPLCPVCGHAFDPVSEAEKAQQAAILAESETRFEDAMELYAKAADGGIPNAPYDICRCLTKSGQAKTRESHYAFWLATAATRSARDAYRYSRYLHGRGEEAKALEQMQISADGGYPMASWRLVLHYLKEGNRPAVRYYLSLLGEKPLAKAVLFLVGKNGVCDHPALPAPSEEKYAEAYSKGSYAEKQGLIAIAKAYYEAAAVGEYLPALERLATLCMQGERDEVAAEEYLMRLGRAGVADAYVDLADYYKNGLIGGKTNVERAYEIYLLAANSGDSRAMVLVGDACYHGEGTATNPFMALSWYDKAAKAGNLLGASRAKETREKGNAMFAEATVLAQAGDHKDAVELYHQAAELGNADAALALGNAHLAGRGTERSYKLAARWYEFAIFLGKESAKYRLGVLYSSNLGVRFDAERAECLLRESLAAGCKQAEVEILRLKKRRNARLARRVYSTACVMYHRGDKLEAIKYLILAVKMENARAAYLLGCIFECGDAVPKDTLRARKYFERAKALGFDGDGNRYMGKYIKNLKK